MNLKIKAIQKAAALTAAFCFLLLPVHASAKGRPLLESGLEIVKKKVINLLIQKQKKQALGTLNDYILSENNKAAVKEAREFRMQIAKKFLTKEAQEAYETSLNLTLENPIEAKKSNEDCLARDPEQLDCLIQRMRLMYREKKKKLIEKDEIKKIDKYFETTDFNWVKASVEKNSSEFKNLNFFKKDSGKPNEEKLILSFLEVDRAILVKNFSKAKEVLALIEKNSPDWPDLIYFKTKIDLESSENKLLTSGEVATQYLNKCKSLSKSVTRKYRYDFDLCLRGVL